MPHLYSSMTSPPCKLRFLLARHRSGRRTASTLRLVEELGGESDNWKLLDPPIYRFHVIAVCSKLKLFRPL